ncbi:helix-turn-helix domain-containing protein [Aquibaculum arenosum]|uniref:Helix-turn-helix transcriptional regulator n=1 Tax=Aquibaculum arenosum TaxID=3032591 RepID=A0ABT5YNU9_9PROT|nr:helix-turn-helix transcriptional regulator [Fodinicurvata sp. CAU 1616]MDF2096645.1 helix-turn-helix transcriptional regulator [Fodinicurvata sp. CAU 1616]
MSESIRTTLTEEIAGTLKAARRRKRLSQRALGELVGLPQSHISRIESGGVNLQLASLIELARVLELELKLIPRKALPAVDSAVRMSMQAARDADGLAGVRPAYVLDEEGEDA